MLGFGGRASVAPSRDLARERIGTRGYVSGQEGALPAGEKPQVQKADLSYRGGRYDLRVQ